MIYRKQIYENKGMEVSRYLTYNISIYNINIIKLQVLEGKRKASIIVD